MRQYFVFCAENDIKTWVGKGEIIVVISSWLRVQTGNLIGLAHLLLYVTDLITWLLAKSKILM